MARQSLWHRPEDDDSRRPREEHRRHPRSPAAHPAPRQGVHPYYDIVLKDVLRDGEELKPLHRARGRVPYSILHAAHPAIGAARMLRTFPVDRLPP